MDETVSAAPAGARCPVETTIDILGGKWKPLILFYLLDGTCRFGELQRRLPQVTRRMLTQHLRELERDGIVHRYVYQQVPPRVDYSLTPLGWSLKPVLDRMLEWGQHYVSQRAGQTSENPPAKQNI
jgi:DNA-binding HxlR family transcriptional regulator